MNHHHREQKAAIITAAFSEWGKSHFTVMSLQPIAARLAITKPALYRYFRNKDDLLDTMITTFADDLGQGLDGFLARSAPPALADAVRDYYGFLFQFFTTRPFYLAFLLFFIIRKAKSLPASLTSRFERLNDYFFSHMESGPTDGGPLARAAAARYIQMHGVFWLMQVFRRDRGEHGTAENRLLDFRKRINRPEAEKIRDQAVVYCLQGYCGRARLSPSVMASIAASCWITPADLPEPDRIFSAVEAVIGEAGLSGASVERIAERIGINKSSLYFYFKNRDEMLKQTIRRERDHFLALLIRCVDSRATFAEKLFAYCTAVFSYMKSNPPLMSVLHWMQYQNIGVAPARDDIAPLIKKFEFLQDAVRSGELEFRGGEPALMLVFVFFLLMNESRFFPQKDAGPRAYAPGLGRIFAMVCHGMSTVAAHKSDTKESRSTQCPKQSVSSRSS
jgi:AcrR family transcriptional regulator